MGSMSNGFFWGVGRELAHEVSLSVKEASKAEGRKLVLQHKTWINMIKKAIQDIRALSHDDDYAMYDYEMYSSVTTQSDALALNSETLQIEMFHYLAIRGCLKELNMTLIDAEQKWNDEKKYLTRDKDGNLYFKDPDKPEESPNKSKSFFESTWFIVLMLFVFPPVGVFLMWKCTEWNKIVKIVISLLFLIPFLGALAK